ncbi:TauD/TfdA family dioxygenase [Kribbella sp. CA-294648]|uniref:TauD/TfdA family dioxygenase n=1 Tax=Kribbella sp. CA-294648 TaxID=3239948 RepID=UPI003D8E1BA9
MTSELARHGAVLLRAPGQTVEAFTSLTDQLMDAVVHEATGTTDREPIEGNTTIATVNRGDDAIPLHREAAMYPGSPGLLAFYCERPAETGGETTICDGIELLSRLDPSIRTFVIEETLVWLLRAPGPRWKAGLNMSSVEHAKSALPAIQAALPSWQSFSAEFEGDTMHAVFRTKAVAPSQFTGQPAFGSTLLAHRYRAPGEFNALNLVKLQLEDGSTYPEHVLTILQETAESLAIEIAWRPGDIVIVDNTRFMHGRRAYSDPARRILLRMGHLKAELRAAAVAN